MKKGIIEISLILNFTVIFTGSIYCQQVKTVKKNSIDTIYLKGVSVTWEWTIDTTGLKILSVLEMEREKSPDKKVEPCGNSDFIVLYDDFSALYFSMGCVWDFQKINWVVKDDSLFFYSQEIGKRIKQKGLKQTEQIASYIFDKGEKIHIGSSEFGFDYMVLETTDYFRPINKSDIVTNYRFKIEKKVNSCNLGYYHQAIRK